MSAFIFADEGLVREKLFEARAAKLDVRLDIVNEPGNVVVSGNPADVEQFAASFQGMGFKVNVMKNSGSETVTSPILSVVFLGVLLVLIQQLVPSEALDYLGWYGTSAMTLLWCGAVVIGFGKLFYYFVRSGFRLQALPYSSDQRPSSQH